MVVNTDTKITQILLQENRAEATTRTLGPTTVLNVSDSKRQFLSAELCA
jgi:hypothetical protein